MLGLPEFGERVRIWPARSQIQNGARTLDSGGRWMAAGGEHVVWAAYHVEQLKAGEIMLHPPPCAKHDFGADGKAELCARCGRTHSEAEAYDALFSRSEAEQETSARRRAPKEQ